MERNVRITWQYKDNGTFALLWGDTAVLTGYAKRIMSTAGGSTPGQQS